MTASHCSSLSRAFAHPRFTPDALAWRVALASGVLAVSWPAGLQAAEVPATLAVVEVNALASVSAFSVTPAEARTALEKTAGGVAVVDAADYLGGRAGTMEDSLRLAPGVFIASRFGSDEARVSIRGSGLQRTFHGRGLMLLQDGVPVNLADGGFDMQAIEPQAVRYIEVQRGANALRHGGSTLGGAINYISQTGRSAPPLVLRAETGSFDYQRYQLAAGGQRGAADGYAALNFSTQDGFRDHARQRNTRFFGNAGFQLSPAVETRFYLTVVDTDSELPGSLTRAQLKADSRQANARAIFRDQHRDFVLYRLANQTAIRHDDGSRTQVAVFAARKDLFHPIEFFPGGPGMIEQRSDDHGAQLRHVRDSSWLGLRQQNTMGLTWHEGSTDNRTYAYLPGPGHAKAGATTLNDQTAMNLTAYGESAWALNERLQVSLGAQWTESLRQLDDRLGTADYRQVYHRTSPKAGVIYRVAEGAEVFANVSGSFEPPSFSEGPVAGQPLAAQKAVTWEVGTRGERRLGSAALSWDLAYYRARLRDELLAIEVNGVSTTQSADQTLHQGVELGLRAAADRWRVMASYLYNDFRFLRSGDALIGDGGDIAGLPRQVFAGEAALRLPGGIWAGPTVRAASRSWVDHANTLSAPGYAVYGIKINQALAGGVEWFIEGRNLADKSYAATTGVIRNAGGADQAQFNPGEGRAVYVGVSKTF